MIKASRLVFCLNHGFSGGLSPGPADVDFGSVDASVNPRGSGRAGI